MLPESISTVHAILDVGRDYSIVGHLPASLVKGALSNSTILPR